MGHRLHYATEYKVKYDGGYFNHKSEVINRILHEQCNADFQGSDVEYAESLEVERRKLLDLIKRWKENPGELDEIINSHGYDYSVEDVLEIFQEIADNSDQSNSFIKLGWW